MNRLIRMLLALGVAASGGCAHRPIRLAPPPPLPPMHTVALPPSGHVTVALRVAFHAGSIDDPPGKEGLTALCAELMAKGGTRSLSAAQLEEKLFPLAAELGAQTDKEETVFYGEVHKDFVSRFAPIFLEVLTAPRLDPKQLERLKQNAIDQIARGLRSGDDEELSRQALLNFIFAGHPYASYVGGSVQGLKSITLEDVKSQIARVFTLDRMTLGVAGGYDPKLVDALRSGLTKLPAKGAPIVSLPPAPREIKVRLVEKDTDSTAMFLGYPFSMKRGEPDYYALAVGISALGEHRQFGGRLFGELRGKRGLNYGDYAYIEHFVQDGWSTYPLTNVPLREQYFSVWVRSVESKNRLFALRAAEYVVKKTAEEGLTADELEKTRGFLATYTRLWEQTDDRKLGYALDDAFYGTKGFLQGYREALKTLTLAQVNAALEKYIDVGQLHVAVVTRGAEGFANDLTSGKPSPIQYASPKPKDVLTKDKLIDTFDLGIRRSDIQLVKADELFER